MPPWFTPFHAYCFGGIGAPPRQSASDPASRPLRIIKNVFVLPELFWVHPDLVCTSRVLDALRSLAAVLVAPVQVVQAFRYPFAIGNRDYRNDSANRASDSSFYQTIARFAEKYACPIPDVSYFELIAPTSATDPARFDDWKTVPGFSWCDADVPRFEYSMKALMSVGMVYSFGYVMRDDVYRAIESFINPDYFEVRFGEI